MSIDAKISDVIFTDGKCILELIDRPPRGPKDYGGIAGQNSLEVVNPFPHARVLKGCCIWGNNAWIRYGDILIGNRIGYDRVELIYPNFIDPFVIMWKNFINKKLFG